MAKARSSDSVPDDIELLNIHRYPEMYAASAVAHVRNSKACQKRLEDLLKNMPATRGKKRIELLEPFTSTSDGSQASPAQQGQGGSLLDSLVHAVRKVLG